MTNRTRHLHPSTDLTPTAVQAVSPPPSFRKRPIARRIGALVVALSALGLTARPAAAAPSETQSPARVQVRIVTGDVADAGTDDPVFVSLRSDHKTWLDSPIDDWERRGNRTYDLTLDNVTSVASITQLQIGKAAPIPAGYMTLNSNAWCLDRVVLLLNGQEVFNRVAPRLAPGDACRWIKGNSPVFTWTGAQLRGDKLWQAVTMPFHPPVLTNSELTERIIAITANQVHDHPVDWAGAGVTVTKRDGGAVHVHIDMTIDVVGPDPSLDIDLDLRFGCVVPPIVIGTKVRPAPYWSITPENLKVNVDSPLWWELVTLSGADVLDHVIAAEIRDGLAVTGTSILTPGGICPQPYVRDNGDVRLLG